MIGFLPIHFKTIKSSNSTSFRFCKPRHSHAGPMDAPAGAKLYKDVTTRMVDNGFKNYTLKLNFVDFGREMILACPHRETKGQITITCSEESEIALVNDRCLEKELKDAWETFIDASVKKSTLKKPDNMFQQAAKYWT
eukprot:193867_1